MRTGRPSPRLRLSGPAPSSSSWEESRCRVHGGSCEGPDHSLSKLGAMAKRICRALLLGCCLIGGALSAQSEQSKPLPVRYREPIQLYSVGLGKFQKKISSKNPEAQAF